MTAPCPWPFSLDGIDEPRLGFAELRSVGPVVWIEAVGVFAVTSHRAVALLLRDPRCVTMSPPPAGPGGPTDGEAVRRTLARMVLLTDPPDHQRRRLPLQRAFEAGVVEPFRAQVRAHGRELVAALTPPADLLGDLARPLFDRTFDDLLRFPSGTTARVRRAWREVSTAVDTPGVPLTAEHDAVVRSLHELLAGHLVAVRAAPVADPPTPIDVLVEAAAEPPTLTDAEVVANLILALSSGHRSATQALALALRTLALHPARYQQLRRQPALVPRAVEELLRWDGSVQFTNRQVVADIELDGVVIPAGSVVMLALGGANHDPAMFPDDHLDFEAERRPHLSFGRGSHYCAGAALARLAVTEALDLVVTTLPALEPAVPPAFTTARRGLDSLQVTW